MLSRKEQDKPGIILPEKWREKVEKVLSQVYQAHIERTGQAFQVHGLTYPDELFLSVGLYDPSNLNESAVSYIMSKDLTEQDKDQEAVLDNLIDSTGVFFDSYFGSPDWNDYVANWTEAEYKKIKFFYKVSRENVALSIQAEQLLNQ